MKREFLQNFKVGDQPLPKEVIDAIMDENGRDITAAKKPYADYDSIKEQLKTAQDGLEAFEGADVKDLRDKIQRLQTELDNKDREHQAKLADMAFDGALKEAITAAKGRNAGAVIGALGAEKIAALKESKDQTKDIQAALDELKKDNGFLFDTGVTPPPYSPGAGGGAGGAPLTGIDAIRAAAGLKTDTK